MSEFFLSRPRVFDAPSGTITFYTTQTLSLKNVFTDINLSIASENPVQLDSNGVMPLRYMNGSYRIIIKDKNGSPVPGGDLDPVQGNPELSGALGTWNSAVIYSALNSVQGSDGLYYKSQVNNNIANDPITDSVNWREIRFIDVFNTNTTYASGVIVQDSTGNLWRSVQSQSGNNPITDSGANWLPSIDIDKTSFHAQTYFLMGV